MQKSILLVVLSFFVSGCAASVAKVPPEKIHAHVASLGIKPSKEIILVDTKRQTLSIVEKDKVKRKYTISTGRKGLGQQINSLKTPLGLHRINEKIGTGVPKYGVFHKRHYIGSVFKPHPRQKKDYISTRILRLEGLQRGFNKGTDRFGKVVDSERRGIYIHGTTLEKALGYPSTKGCVHMSADDVMNLFEEVPVGTLVWIN